MIYNDGLPQDLGFVKRDTPESYLRLELDTEFIGSARAIGKKHLSRIVEACFKTGAAPKASYVLDAIKERGYKYSTLAALTTSVFDMKIPPEKAEIVDHAEAEVSKIAKKYARGLLNEEERYLAVISQWDNATDKVAGLLKKQGEEDKFNPIWMMRTPALAALSTRLSSFRACADSWSTRRVKRSRFPSNPVSETGFPFWNISFLRTAEEKV